MRAVLSVALFLVMATLAVADGPAKKSSPQEEKKPTREALTRAKKSVNLTVEYGEKKSSTGQKGRVIEIAISGAKEPLRIFLVEPGTKPGEERQIGLLRLEEKRNPGWRWDQKKGWGKSQPIKPIQGRYTVKVTDEEGHVLAQKIAD